MLYSRSLKRSEDGSCQNTISKDPNEFFLDRYRGRLARTGTVVVSENFIVVGKIHRYVCSRDLRKNGLKEVLQVFHTNLFWATCWSNSCLTPWYILHQGRNPNKHWNVFGLALRRGKYRVFSCYDRPHFVYKYLDDVCSNFKTRLSDEVKN